MCPLWPAHYLLMYILALGPLWLLSFRVVGAAANAAAKWDVQFSPASIKLDERQTQPVEIRFNKTAFLGSAENGSLHIEYIIDDLNIASVSPGSVTLDVQQMAHPDFDYPSFNVTGSFLGYAKVRARAESSDESSRTTLTYESDPLPVAVNRVPGPLDKAFTYSVAALVAIIYINMGAALDTSTVMATMKKPIGPIIGFCTQFGLMPLLAFGIGRWLIAVPALRLGLFITGCSPGGGASNIWTLAMGGNLDLSITMTTISTFSAFLMMPLWILSLGASITSEANLVIPYSKICVFALGLVVPLAIGVLIQRTLPKTAKVLVKMLKPFAVFLIIFIVIFAVYTNWYLLKVFTWEILLSGLLLPWLGYLSGGGMALLCRQSWRDVIAIGVETGVQNTGLAIFALRFSLPQPEADLTTALPVAVAVMTPILPTLVVLYQKLRSSKCFSKEKKEPLGLYGLAPSGGGGGVGGAGVDNAGGPKNHNHNQNHSQTEAFITKC